MVAALACAFAPNEYVLAAARFVMGLGVGIDLPVAMAFLAEFSRLRGQGNKAASVAMWCPTWYAAISISYLLVLLLYAVLPESHTDWLWRLILGFGAVPALLIIAIRSRYMSESPIWAANQGNLQVQRQSCGGHITSTRRSRRMPSSLPYSQYVKPASATMARCCKAFTAAVRYWQR